MLPPVLLSCVMPRNASGFILALAVASPEIGAGGCVRGRGAPEPVLLLHLICNLA